MNMKVCLAQGEFGLKVKEGLVFSKQTNQEDFPIGGTSVRNRELAEHLILARVLLSLCTEIIK